jgi:hypothetical protein
VQVVETTPRRGADENAVDKIYPRQENVPSGSCEEIGQESSTELLRKSKMTVHCRCDASCSANGFD